MRQNYLCKNLRVKEGRGLILGQYGTMAMMHYHAKPLAHCNSLHIITLQAKPATLAVSRVIA
jgi:hypothetical protein